MGITYIRAPTIFFNKFLIFNKKLHRLLTKAYYDIHSYLYVDIVCNIKNLVTSVRSPRFITEIAVIEPWSGGVCRLVEAAPTIYHYYLVHAE